MMNRSILTFYMVSIVFGGYKQDLIKRNGITDYFIYSFILYWILAFPIK